MSFGLPAYFSESRAYRYQPHQLIMVTKSAFDDLKWRYESRGDNVLAAKISLNALSWGENFSVEIFPDGLVEAVSKCAYPLQWVDWGKNKRNVETFFSKLELTMKIELG